MHADQSVRQPREVAGTRSERHDLMQEADEGSRRPCLRIGPEILAAKFFRAADREDAGESLVRYHDIHPALVVLQVNVVFRVALLDKPGLEKERFLLVRDGDPFDSSDLGQHLLFGRLQPWLIRPVGGNPVSQIFGFAYVDDLILRIKKKIRAWLLRYVLGRLLHIGKTISEKHLRGNTGAIDRLNQIWYPILLPFSCNV